MQLRKRLTVQNYPQTPASLRNRPTTPLSAWSDRSQRNPQARTDSGEIPEISSLPELVIIGSLRTVFGLCWVLGKDKTPLGILTLQLWALLSMMLLY